MLHPRARGAPPSGAIMTKLGAFSKVPDLIKHVKRHLDRTHVSTSMRESYFPYSHAVVDNFDVVLYITVGNVPDLAFGVNF